MQISKVDRNGAQVLEFAEFPRRLLGRSGSWIAPFPQSIARELGDTNLFFKHGGEAQLFVARDTEGKIVGRIAASIDPRLEGARDIGHIGYFECVDDIPVARALFDAAEGWLRERGKTVVHGPMQLNIYTGYRLQTSGYDRKPFLGEPRCPSYYPALWEACGYKRLTQWRSWDIPFWKSFAIAIAMLLRRPRLPEGYRYEEFRADDIREQLQGMHGPVMDFFAENYGFSRISAEEYFDFNALAPLIMAEGLCGRIFNREGEIVAFSYTFNNRSKPFVEADGNLSKMDFARLPSLRSRELVMHSWGIRKDHRKSGIAEFLICSGVSLFYRSGYWRVIGALSKEGRTVFDRIGPATRSYAMYSRELS
jgi:hypothetical protein